MNIFTIHNFDIIIAGVIVIVHLYVFFKPKLFLSKNEQIANSANEIVINSANISLTLFYMFVLFAFFHIIGFTWTAVVIVAINAFHLLKSYFILRSAKLKQLQ